MRMKNPTDRDVYIEGLNLVVKPGKSVEIEDAYCAPRKGAGTNANPMPSVIAMLAPQLEPEDPQLAEEFRRNKHVDGLGPTPPAPKSAADLTADGMAPAVAELVAGGQAASVPKVTPKVPR